MTITKNKKAVILLSGGLDSATCLAIAKDQKYDVHAISFNYGQRHSKEVESAKKIGELFKISSHQVINIDLKAFGGSSLTSDLEVPKNQDFNKNTIPNTYVPARNTIFLSYAIAKAEVLNSFDIFIGVNSVDYSGYPDCRPEYIEAYTNMANLATKNGIEGKTLTIHTPLIDMTKAQIIKTGVKLGIDYSLTHSCYDPSDEGYACGACDSCKLRKKGFIDAGIKDPTIYSA